MTDDFIKRITPVIRQIAKRKTINVRKKNSEGKIVNRQLQRNEYLINHTFMEEDIEQELWTKIIQLYQADPILRQETPVNQIRIVKRVCNNKLVDIIRYYTRRKDTNSTVASWEDLTNAHQVLEDMMGIMGIRFRNIDSSVEYEQIRNLMMNWAKNQDLEVQMLVKEQLDPSPETMMAYDKMCAQRRNLAAQDVIPGITLCDILGLNRKVWFSAARRMQRMLISHGYHPQLV